MKKSFALLFLLLFCCSDFLAAQSAWQFENAVRNYAYQAIDNPPVPGCTLFVGSSSFALWKTLEETFADYEAVNRGFGGSKFPDNLRAIERIHLPADPSRVVIFCGTNDIAGGADAETVFNNFKFYIARIWNEFPATEIYFVCPTHAPVREKHWKTGDELFAKVQALAEKVGGLYCIDIRPAMLGEDGKVREDLFVKDRLHLNADGYAIWEKVFKETLDAKAKDQKAPNLAELYLNRKSTGIFDDPRFAEQGIVVRNYAAPASPHTKNITMIFIGDSITQGVGLVDRKGAAPNHCGNYLAQNGYVYTVSNSGKNGATTVDFLPKNAQHFQDVTISANRFKEDKGSELIFSIMLGTNDSAVKGTNGAPVSPEDYRRNLKEISDKLLADYPAAKIVIHRPIWYSPNTQNNSTYLLEGHLRLRAYFAEIETLVDYYAQTSAKDQVFLGDVDAFNYFGAHAEELLLPEKGKSGTFYLHPNKKGAEILGRFWGAAILKAVQ